MTDEPIGAAWLDQVVRITSDGNVYFGETKVPGIILDGGVTLRPGGKKDFNSLTIEFIVGRVEVEDSPA